MISMTNHNPARVVLMLVGFFTCVAAIMFNLLSGYGEKSGVFMQRTEDVNLKYTTPITPAQWVFFIWDFIYFWIFSMFIYFLAGLCRRSSYDWMYTTPAVLPYGFHVTTIINLGLNITWLFLYDRELLLPALITSALMTATDYTILFFSCYGLKIYGAWLNKYHNADLWIFRLLVQNGVAVYATWGTLSNLLNLTIFMQHQTETSRCNCTMLSMLLLLMELLVWFLLENFYLDKHVRYIVSIYPVVILWLLGIMSNSGPPESQTYIFAASILVTSCILFVARITLVTWRHLKQPLYKDIGPDMSPVEIGDVLGWKQSSLGLSKNIYNSTNYALICIGSIFLAFFTQIISEVFFALAKESSVPNGLFQTSSRNASESLPLEVTMGRWSENCWIMIDLWSKGWLVYAVVSLFKRNVLGPEFCNPEIHPPKFYLMWATISIARICSGSLWDQQWILPVYSFFMLYISYSNLNQHKAWLAINNPSVIQLTRYLTQNGLAAFAWWSLLHALVDLGIVLKYYAFVKDPLVSTIVLSIVFMCIMTWFSLQSFYCTKYMRHTFSVHAILVLGLGSMFTNSYGVQNFSVNTTICGVNMLLVTIMSFIHLIQVCVEKTHTPLAAAPNAKFEGCETACDLEGNIKHKQ